MLAIFTLVTTTVSSPPSMPPSDDGLSTGAIIGIAVGGGIFVLCMLVLCIWCYCCYCNNAIADEEIRENPRLLSTIPPSRGGFPDAGLPRGWDDNTIIVNSKDPTPEYHETKRKIIPDDPRGIAPARKPVTTTQTSVTESKSSSFASRVASFPWKSATTAGMALVSSKKTTPSVAPTQSIPSSNSDNTTEKIANIAMTAIQSKK